MPGLKSRWVWGYFFFPAFFFCVAFRVIHDNKLYNQTRRGRAQQVLEPAGARVRRARRLRAPMLRLPALSSFLDSMGKVLLEQG